MADVKGPKDVSLAELRCSQFFADADRDTMEAFRRVLVAQVEDQTGRLEWGEFEHDLAQFSEYARIRHAARFYATQEARMITTPIVVVIEDDGTQALATMDPETIRNILKKQGL